MAMAITPEGKVALIRILAGELPAATHAYVEYSATVPKKAALRDTEYFRALANRKTAGFLNCALNSSKVVGSALEYTILVPWGSDSQARWIHHVTLATRDADGNDVLLYTADITPIKTVPDSTVELKITINFE